MLTCLTTVAVLTLWIPKAAYERLRWNQFSSSLKGSTSLNKLSSITLHYVCWWTAVTNLCKMQRPKISARGESLKWIICQKKVKIPSWCESNKLLFIFRHILAIKGPMDFFLKSNNAVLCITLHYTAITICTLKEVWAIVNHRSTKQRHHRATTIGNGGRGRGVLIMEKMHVKAPLIWAYMRLQQSEFTVDELSGCFQRGGVLCINFPLLISHIQFYCAEL